MTKPGLRLEERAARVGADEVERVGHEVPDALFRRPARRPAPVQPDAEAPLVVVRRRRQHVILAREVAVERAPRDPGRLGDLLHAQPPDAAAPDQAQGGGEDALLGGAEASGSGPMPTPACPSSVTAMRDILDTFCPFVSDSAARVSEARRTASQAVRSLHRRTEGTTNRATRATSPMRVATSPRSSEPTVRR